MITINFRNGSFKIFNGTPHPINLIAGAIFDPAILDSHWHK